MPGPQAPPELRQLEGRCLRLGHHTVVASHSVVLPAGDFGDGAALGALSLAKQPLEPWSIYAGIPARRLRPRDRRCEELAARVRPVR